MLQLLFEKLARSSAIAQVVELGVAADLAVQLIVKIDIEAPSRAFDGASPGPNIRAHGTLSFLTNTI
jgi:hypothetical protein